jgi:hypothetical protein
MQDFIKASLKKGLLGANAHRDARKVVLKLTPKMARMKSNKIFHSAWELIHHIVVWQDAILNGLEGKVINWKDIGRKNNWPSQEVMADDSNFLGLIENFNNGLEKAKKLIDSIDLFNKVHLWEDLSSFEALLGLVQHNSYHIGQIITVRKILDNWHIEDWVIEE